MTVIEMNQFYSPTPYALSKEPMRWATLLAEVQAGEWNSNPRYLNPKVLEVAEDGSDYTPPMATTTYREGADGNVEVWRSKWDTSG